MFWGAKRGSYYVLWSDFYLHRLLKLFICLLIIGSRKMGKAIALSVVLLMLSNVQDKLHSWY